MPYGQKTSWSLEAFSEVHALQQALQILKPDRTSLSRGRLIRSDGTDVVPWWPTRAPRVW